MLVKAELDYEIPFFHLGSWVQCFHLLFYDFKLITIYDSMI